MKYKFVVYTQNVADAVLNYAKEQYVFEYRLERIEGYSSVYEIEVECTPHQMERIFGFMDGLLHLQ